MEDRLRWIMISRLGTPCSFHDLATIPALFIVLVTLAIVPVQTENARKSPASAADN